MKNCIFLLLIICQLNGYAQPLIKQLDSIDSQKKIAKAMQNPKPQTTLDNVITKNTFPTKPSKTPEETTLTIYFLIFGFLILIMTYAIIIRQPSEIHNLFKYFIIVLLVLGVLVLISIGYDKEQIAPAVGLFGTIAGYLLGKSDKTSNPSVLPNTGISTSIIPTPATPNTPTVPLQGPQAINK
jgi:hypothetical protein